MQECVLLFSLIVSISSNPILNTTSGVYRGRFVSHENRTIEQFLGIQYARIPQRFHRAQLIEKQNEMMINATVFGPICKPVNGQCTIASNMTFCSLTYGMFSVVSRSIEQCLYLNIFKPTSQSKRKRAIFMWIHGGSGQTGTGNLFDGTILAALGDFIVVTFNFRLNLYGFLSSGDQRLEGNLGLYDQSLVLDWITKNIDALNGDSQRITVGGHSAGAPHAYYLARSSLNQGRIHRLILQSGCPFNIWSHLKTSQLALDKFQTIVKDNQCGTTRNFDEQFQCLERKDFSQLVEYEHQAYTSADHTNVVLTGDLMSNFHRDLQNNQTLNDIDMLIGANDDEGLLAALVPILIEQNNPENLSFKNINFREISFKFLSAIQPEKTCLFEQAFELYQINPLSHQCYQSSDCYCSAFYNYSRLISDLLFYKDYYQFLAQHLSFTNRTYLYHYSYPSSQQHPTSCREYLAKHNRVGHFAELEYTWGRPLSSRNLNYSKEQIDFSRQLIEYWSNFINQGQPNVHWRTDGFYMHINLTKIQLKQFKIPSNIVFWTQTCRTNEHFDYFDFFFFVLLSLLLF